MENNAVSCKLKITKDLNEKTPVFLADFSNACVNFTSIKKLKFNCYRRTVDTEVKRILCARNDRLKYESVCANDIDDKNKLRYYVGVRNKTTNRIKVYDSVSFNLKPVIKTSWQSSTSDEIKQKKERMDDLTIRFGSKGMKRSMTERQRSVADSTALDDALEDMSIDQPQTGANISVVVPKTSTNIDYIPPQNSEAKFVKEVYKVSDIISAEADEYLTEEAQKLKCDFSFWKTDNAFCEYILCHLKEELNDEKVKYLLYYNYLVMFSNLLSSDVKKKDPAPGIPDPIKSNLLECFTVTSRTENNKIIRSFPLKMKDKLLAYIIVLALFIDNYHVNLALLQKGLKFGMPKIANVARALGCHVTNQKVENSSMQFAVLKLPLFVLQKYNKKF